MASAGTFCVVGVDGPAAESCDGVVNIARLVQRVRVDRDGDVVLVRKGERRVNGGGRGAPVLMELETSRASFEHFQQTTTGVRRVPLARKTEVQRQVVSGAKHHLDLRRRWCASRRIGTCRGAGASAVHGREARRHGLLGELRADEVDVRVEASRGNDELLASDGLGGHPDDHTWRYAVHHVWVPCLSDTDDTVALDTNVGLNDASLCIQNQRIRDHCVQRLRC
mmetsp:Transcript_86435/g.241858  ORF Transcript_86435/g.241858 Transcript_86435/m.241858 type:complete len:224 (-) Transcript_86435:1136-1807(-)